MNQLKDSRVCSAAVWLLIGYWGCLSGIQWATPTHFKRRGAIYQSLFDQSPWSEASGLPVFWSARTREAAWEEFCLLDVRAFYNRLRFLDKVLKDLNVQVISLNLFLSLWCCFITLIEQTDFINLLPWPNSSLFFFLSHPSLLLSIFLRSEVLFYCHLLAMKLGSTYRVVIALKTLFVR